VISHPLLDEIQAERDVLVARDAALGASATVAREAHAAEEAEWKVDHDLAVDLGAGPPARPDPLDLREVDRERAGIRNELERLAVRERKVLAQIAPEIEADLAVQADEVRIEMASHRTGIKGGRQRLAAILRDAHTVRSAVDLADPNCRPAMGYGLKARSLQQVTNVDVIEDVDVLALAPLPGIPDTAPHADRAPVQPRIGGLNPPGAFGTPPTQPKRQPPREDFT